MAEHAVELSQAQSRLRELVQEAVRGAEVILTDGGEPVARIIPIDRAQGRREFGSARGMIHMADDFDAPLEEFREYM
jgi:prevent-host-death family protein